MNLPKHIPAALIALASACVSSCVPVPVPAPPAPPAPPLPPAHVSVAYHTAPAAEVVYGSVVQTRRIRIAAPEESKAVGMVVGAGAGFAAGQLIGSGGGRAAATMGLTLLGAAAGHGVGAVAGQSAGQELFIRADADGRVYCIRQPIFVEIGEIPVGVHGYLTLGGGRNLFRPDGY